MLMMLFYELLKRQNRVRSQSNTVFSAQDKTRTCTAFRPLPPQSSVYTNFTTWAFTPKIEQQKQTKYVSMILGNSSKELRSAQDRTRTYTAVKPLVPETSVYTNFTTWASRVVPLGFEPRLTEPKPAVLPLHNGTIRF